MSHQPTASRSRAGVVTARALRFGLRPGSPEVQIVELLRLAEDDPAVLAAARHQIVGSTTTPLFIDPTRRRALDLLDQAEDRLRSRPAA